MNACFVFLHTHVADWRAVGGVYGRKLLSEVSVKHASFARFARDSTHQLEKDNSEICTFCYQHYLPYFSISIKSAKETLLLWPTSINCFLEHCVEKDSEVACGLTCMKGRMVEWIPALSSTGTSFLVPDVIHSILSSHIWDALLHPSFFKRQLHRTLSDLLHLGVLGTLGWAI